MSAPEKRQVSGYENLYDVDENGSIWSVASGIGRKLTPIVATHGYCVVSLYKNRKAKQHRVHILVARAFIPNPENKPTVNHDDGDKTNNAASNLTWMTPLEQSRHASENRLLPFGERNKSTKITESIAVIARDRILAGELIQDVAASFGVSRNTVTKALTARFGSAWDGSLSEKRRRANRVRWRLAEASFAR